MYFNISLFIRRKVLFRRILLKSLKIATEAEMMPSVATNAIIVLAANGQWYLHVSPFLQYLLCERGLSLWAINSFSLFNKVYSNPTNN